MIVRPTFLATATAAIFVSLVSMNTLGLVVRLRCKMPQEVQVPKCGGIYCLNTIPWQSEPYTMSFGHLGTLGVHFNSPPQQF